MIRTTVLAGALVLLSTVLYAAIPADRERAVKVPCPPCDCTLVSVVGLEDPDTGRRCIGMQFVSGEMQVLCPSEDGSLEKRKYKF